MAYATKITVGSNSYDIKDSLRKYYKESEVEGVVGSGKSTTYDVTDATVTSYVDGLMVSFVLPCAGIGTYGSIFQINSLGYHPIVYNVNSVLGTRYSAGSTITMVYNSVQTATGYETTTAKTYTGCWQVCDYDVNTTTCYGTVEYYFRPYVGANTLYRYKICALDKDNRLAPIVITEQTSTTQVAKTPNSVAIRPEKFWLYNATTNISTGSLVTASVLDNQIYLRNGCNYNFNTSIPAYRMIYLRGTYNSTTGLFTLYNDGASKCTSYYCSVPNDTADITLSSYFTSGYYYILIGSTYSSSNYLQLFDTHPMYYFDGTNLIPFEQQQANLKSTKGHTHSVSITSGTPSATQSVLTSVKSAGSTPTLGTSISATKISSWSEGSLQTLTATPTETSSGSGVYNVTLSLTGGSVPSLGKSDVTIPNVTSVGAMPTFNTGTAAGSTHTHSVSGTTGADA